MKEILIDGTTYLVDLEKAQSLGLIKLKSLTPATLKQGQKYKNRRNGNTIYMGCVNPDFMFKSSPTHSFTPQVKAAQTKVLKQIKDIEARKKKFIEYTVSFYNLGNRRYDEREGMCFYNACKTSPGCAIGRWPDKNSGFNFKAKAYINNEYINSNLPDWMKEMGIEFLQKVQNLHDKENNWNKEGLSEIGVNYCVTNFGYEP